MAEKDPLRRRVGKTIVFVPVTLLLAVAFAWAAYHFPVRTKAPAPKAVAPAVYRPAAVPAPPAGPVYYTNEVVVLMYHDLNAAGKPGDVITPRTFAGELALFQKDNFHPISDRQLDAFVNHKGTVPPNAILITFDNGYESFYRTAYPLLQKYHDPATLFVIVSWLYPPHRHGIFHSLTWDQVEEMYQSGLVSIQSQTYDLHQGVPVGPHATSAASVGLIWNPATGRRETPAAYRARVLADVSKARRQLQDRLGEPVDSLCYPFGDYTPAFIQVLHQAGYRYLYTAKIGRAVLPDTSPDTLFRINSGTPGITPQGLVDTIIGVARASARTPSWKPPARSVEVWYDTIVRHKPSRTTANAPNGTVSATQNPKVPAPSNTLPIQVKDIIQQKYGEIRNEFRAGDDWALTTLGNKNSNGVIGLYHCSPKDTACLNGQTPLSLAGWSFYKAPFPGGVTLLRETGNTLIIDNGGHQITFDVATHSYNPKLH